MVDRIKIRNNCLISIKSTTIFNENTNFIQKKLINSIEIVKKRNIKIIKNPKNMGKGYSIKNGMLNSDADYLRRAFR